MLKLLSEFGSGLSRTCRPSSQRIIALLFFSLLFSGCGQEKNEITAEHRMGAMFLSRSDINDIKMYKDQRYIHGLKFFNLSLPSEDVGRVVAWLRMTEQVSIPPILSDEVASAASVTGWKFKWANPKIYVAFYCHPFDGSNSSIDMLLVNEGAAVFVTEGYLPPGSYPTTDPSTCGTRPQRPSVPVEPK